MTRADLLRDAVSKLSAAGVDSAPREARLLLRWASGLDGAALSAALNEPPDPAEIERYRTALARRAAREPLSHITGTREFWGRTFHVSKAVLDPRPETETLIAAALEHGPVARILDLGTGSGCIAVTLLAEWPKASATATDISPQALEVAARNAAAHGVTDRLHLVECDWTSGLLGQFDLIVSNPPYITEDAIPALAPEVRDHEPKLALTPGGDGLDAYRTITAAAPGLVAPGGRIMVEIGYDQAPAVSGFFAAAGLCDIDVIADLDQRPRIVTARA